MKGQQVALAQCLLNLRGYGVRDRTLVIDGHYGYQTIARVKDFQNDYGYRATGKLTFHQIEFLIGEDNLDVVHAQPPKTSNIQAESPVLPLHKQWAKNIIQSLSTRSVVSITCGLLVSGVVIIAVTKDYSVHLRIKELVEIFLSAPIGRRPSESSEDQSSGISSPILVLGQQTERCYLLGDVSQQNLDELLG
jgi:peptidoglycan hydrolase-like protein with peptidoglycan-binding domain